MEQAICELLAAAARLGEPPSIVGKAEVDQINIISRWIHRHSNDRAFFPIQQALSDEDEARTLAQSIWVTIDSVRKLPPAVDDEASQQELLDDEDVTE